MHKKFLKYFVDPISHERLELLVTENHGNVIISGTLKSSISEFPIIRGIPRFVDFELKNYNESFSYEWEKWPKVQFESENIGKPMEGHTLNMWEAITGISNNLKSNTVLDIGCGSGRFIDIARRKGATVIGVDYSAAVEVANENFMRDENVCICQADALNLPFKRNSFDGAYSIGVLHHTPSPKEGLKQAFSVVKPGGWVAISVYAKGSRYDTPITHFWRGVFKGLWPLFKHYPPLFYTYSIVFFSRTISFLPLFRKSVKFFFPNVYLPDINWSLLDTFDRVTPSYQSGHDSYEIFSWFKDLGFISIEPTNWGHTSYRGLVSIKQ